MKLKFYNPQTVERNIKATTHRTGKLGFSSDAAIKFNLGLIKFLKIAVNEDDDNDTRLFGFILDAQDPEAVKISKAGEYYFANLKMFFDSIKLDYTSKTYIYDITEEKIDGMDLLVFTRREVIKKKGSTAV